MSKKLDPKAANDKAAVAGKAEKSKMGNAKPVMRPDEMKRPGKTQGRS
ncbi:hypothetical protein [Paracoccus aminophilus]|nr:hypothetical protein [Paracoccus aminophilus]